MSISLTLIAIYLIGIPLFYCFCSNVSNSPDKIIANFRLSFIWPVGLMMILCSWIVIMYITLWVKIAEKFKGEK